MGGHLGPSASTHHGVRDPLLAAARAVRNKLGGHQPGEALAPLPASYPCVILVLSSFYSLLSTFIHLLSYVLSICYLVPTLYLFSAFIHVIVCFYPYSIVCYPSFYSGLTSLDYPLVLSTFIQMSSQIIHNIYPS